MLQVCNCLSLQPYLSLTTGYWVCLSVCFTYICKQLISGFLSQVIPRCWAEEMDSMLLVWRRSMTVWGPRLLAEKRRKESTRGGRGSGVKRPSTPGMLSLFTLSLPVRELYIDLPVLFLWVLLTSRPVF